MANTCGCTRAGTSYDVPSIEEMRFTQYGVVKVVDIRGHMVHYTFDQYEEISRGDIRRIPLIGFNLTFLAKSPVALANEKEVKDSAYLRAKVAYFQSHPELSNHMRHCTFATGGWGGGE